MAGSIPDMVTAFSEEFASLRRLAERALAQVGDERFFATLDQEANSLAVLVKHVGGNLRSRWTAFRTTDGEKPDRDRDGEFLAAGLSRREVEAIWASGWHAVEQAVGGLSAEELGATIHIRGEPTTIGRALTRSLAHTAGHVHQIILLARHWQGAEWQTLSIPRGQSEQFRQRMAARFDNGSKGPAESGR